MGSLSKWASCDCFTRRGFPRGFTDRDLSLAGAAANSKKKSRRCKRCPGQLFAIIDWFVQPATDFLIETVALRWANGASAAKSQHRQTLPAAGTVRSAHISMNTILLVVR